MADQFNYFFNYPAQVNAIVDPDVGPLLIAQGHPGINPLWVYDLRQGGVVTLPGYWCMVISNYPNLALLNNPNLQFVVDLNLAVQNPSVISAIFTNMDISTVANLQIISAYGPYVQKGLLAINSDWILATGFWRDLGFWRDTAVWID